MMTRMRRWVLSDCLKEMGIFGVGMGIGWDIPLHFVQDGTRHGSELKEKSLPGCMPQ
jgi:hypothetical protein